MEDKALVSSQVKILINEDAEVKDFVFTVPQNCSYELAKKSILSMYEYIIRLEVEALLKQQELVKEAKPETEEVVLVDAEVAG